MPSENLPDPYQAGSEELTLPEVDEDDVEDSYWWFDGPDDDRPLWQRDQPDLVDCTGCGRVFELDEVGGGICAECSEEKRAFDALRARWANDGLRTPIEADDGPVCRHCQTDPVAYPAQGACRPCYQWLRRNVGKYPPHRLEIELKAQVERRLTLRHRRASTPP